MLPAPLRRTPLALAMLCAIAGLSLTACKPKTNATSPAPVAAAPAAAPTVGIDLAGIDKAVQPGDDFYTYANGIWQQKTDIPADRASTGVFYTVFEKAEKRLSDLVLGLQKQNPAAGSNARKIADYYAAYMDEAGIEAHGMAPLQAKLFSAAQSTPLRISDL